MEGKYSKLSIIALIILIITFLLFLLFFDQIAEGMAIGLSFFFLLFLSLV